MCVHFAIDRLLGDKVGRRRCHRETVSTTCEYLTWQNNVKQIKGFEGGPAVPTVSWLKLPMVHIFVFRFIFFTKNRKLHHANFSWNDRKCGYSWSSSPRQLPEPKDLALTPQPGSSPTNIAGRLGLWPPVRDPTRPVHPQTVHLLLGMESIPGFHGMIRKTSGQRVSLFGFL